MTQNLVKELFDYKDGFLYWKLPTNTKIKIGSLAGCIPIRNGEKRIKIQIYRKKYFLSRLIFIYHKGYLPKVVDHENGDTLDDRIENLRAATNKQNNSNRRSVINSSSKYLGVNLHSNKKAWEAAFSIDNKRQYIGYFNSESKAALAYNREAVRNYGEFANLNIVQP